MPSPAMPGKGQPLSQTPARLNMGSDGEPELELAPRHAVVTHGQSSRTVAMPCPLDQPISYPCSSHAILPKGPQHR